MTKWRALIEVYEDEYIHAYDIVEAETEDDAHQETAENYPGSSVAIYPCRDQKAADEWLARNPS